ncbi:helix-turn-helix domain-containing protein [Clostridium algidicarnis]|uniref:helix-turn-helix domain-containing protein n=1 Tax=Clostridium algidicarnis TaxID=37659 RepID=UPI001C0B7133|nr:helix-turn-helix transcriptional regulator [Clostridium algidicarnis]MBU3227817.1 helix-turn-helix domain-containing protein [Clostridium algidicarnis]MBU3251568.1 helix-turn-helix domain-containing protein [Clostridium algidicarnis]
MEKLKIGEVIYNLRKEKGVTQEELAHFIGISAAAVSKWESGISYPDITLLTGLATFFNVTIDKLLNFKIELSDEEVMKIYSECEALFSNKYNLEEAIEVSKNNILNHSNSYLLKLRIGCLFFAYSCRDGDEIKGNDMLRYAIKLFEDVSVNCTKMELVEGALFQLGAIYTEFEEYDKANEVTVAKRTLTLNLYETISKIFEEPIYDVIRENKEFISILNELKRLETSE